MKRRILCLILSIMLTAALLCSCGEPAEESGRLLYIKDSSKAESITAVFKSTQTGKTEEVQLKKIDSQEEYTEFSCSADTSEYDRVTIVSDSSSTPELAYNDYVSGWELGSRRFYPYTHGKENTEPKYERKSFEYQNRTKDILIWIPEDYQPFGEKVSVIYMTDGQNLLSRSATSTGSWGAAESVAAMAAMGGERCMIVGIENADGWRDDELTPNIGEVLSPEYEDGHGQYFSDFLVNVVMPYINENYNVYTDREHTHICGSSSGGIESFYIAMEHPDRFASVGALSPAFILFGDDTWVEYLKAKDFSKYAPLIYLYCGKSDSDSLEQMLCSGVGPMMDDLSAAGYPKDKIVKKIYDDGVHNEMYWRAVFPDYLKYAFPNASQQDAEEQ